MRVKMPGVAMERKRRIVGTAGHIDHGKTALVQALTGVDCDRLPEEKRRGITIDLGFANWNTDQFQIGFIDVPGHERFVKNMLAGVGGIDSVLLVVAADESIKPQTREHFAICRLLGIQAGLVAITKSDLVEDDIVQLVRLEIEDLVRGSFLEHKPVIAVSAVTGEGIEALREALVESVQGVEERDVLHRPFRLPIDRSFTMKGFGSIVTGTSLSGSVTSDSEIEVLPSGVVSRARNVQVHGSPREEAFAGERTSINLSDVSLDRLHRGEQVVSAGVFRPSSVLTVELRLLEDAPALKDQTRVRFHLYSAERIGSIRILSGQDRTVAPGGRVRAQVRLDVPVVAVAGDRFVIRRYSPAITMGGGVVLDPHLPRLSRTTRDEVLDALTSPDFGQRVEQLTRFAGLQGLSMRDLESRTGILAEELRRRLANAPAHDLLTISGSNEVWLHRAHVKEFRAAAMNFLQDYFEQNRMTTGVSKGEFIQKLIPGQTDARIVEFLLSDLVSESIIVIQGDRIDVPGRSKELGGQEGELARLLEKRFLEAGLKAPSVTELVQTIPRKPKVIEGLVPYLVKTGVLVRLAEGLFVHRDVLEEARRRLAEHSGETIDVAWFKNFFDLTRKVAIPLLEYFDQSGVTRRVGDSRRIL